MEPAQVIVIATVTVTVTVIVIVIVIDKCPQTLSLAIWPPVRWVGSVDARGLTRGVARGRPWPERGQDGWSGCGAVDREACCRTRFQAEA